jgi:hypothetical protein
VRSVDLIFEHERETIAIAGHLVDLVIPGEDLAAVVAGRPKGRRVLLRFANLPSQLPRPPDSGCIDRNEASRVSEFHAATPALCDVDELRDEREVDGRGRPADR